MYIICIFDIVLALMHIFASWLSYKAIDDNYLIVKQLFRLYTKRLKVFLVLMEFRYIYQQDETK